jgi:AcrR family transcriptional regulator
LTKSTRRTAARGRAGRKSPALSKARIVAAALAVTSRDGIAGLSARKLGAELGVEAMSIYHHFPSKRHLLDALVDHAIGSIEFPPPGPPIARLRALCHRYRAMAHRYPQLYPLVGLHRLNTEVGVLFLERVLGLVHDVVGEPERAARQFRALGYYLMGAGFDETAGYAHGPSAAEPVDDAFIARHCPRLAAAAPYFRAQEWEATFDAGLDALFAGLETPRGGLSRQSHESRQPRGARS